MKPESRTEATDARVTASADLPAATAAETFGPTKVADLRHTVDDRSERLKAYMRERGEEQ